MRVCRSCCGSCTCTLNTPSNYSGCAVPSTVSLSGITSSGGGVISVGATSSNTSVVPTPSVTYTSPNTTGAVNLTFTAGTGTATISVTVSSTACASVTKTFIVSSATTSGPPTLNAIANQSIPVNSLVQSVGLSGIGFGFNPGGLATAITVTASSNNPGLIPNPTVTYTSPNTTGTLQYTPNPLITGVATINVTVTTNGPGPGINPCNSVTFTQSFTVTVT